MPIGNPLGYFKTAGAYGKKIFNAQNAKQTSVSVAKRARTGMSSGARSMAKHPYKTGAAGVAGAGVVSYVGGGRRGRGVDKMGRGRPTGIYKY